MDDVLRDTFYGGAVRSWDNNGVQIFLLKAENDIVYVFTHFLRHFYKGGIDLRQICDWIRLIWTYKEKMDVRLLESRIQKMGLMTEWKAFYALATKYLGMPEISGAMFQVSGDKKWEKKADLIMEFVLESGYFGHNRDMSYYSKYPFVVRKTISMGRRIADMFKHSRIFPIDTLRFMPYIVINGLRSAARGE